MTIQSGFTKMTIDEFETLIGELRVARTVLFIQQHHTFSPDYSLFDGTNHFQLQKGMKNHHVNHNGWADIGQHFTSFPDGSIVTGRSMEKSPACITGNNANSVCMEHLGNFDTGKDAMTVAQRDCIIRMTAALCFRFNVPVNPDKIVYHHWFDLGTGERNNGTKNNKSCPGTAFFGGNKIPDCEMNFLPLVLEKLDGQQREDPAEEMLRYVSVTASKLNVRKKPSADSDKATDREPASFGAILRVYKEKDGWLKISSSKQHWVSGRLTTDVQRAQVTADALNVRSGPGTGFSKVGSFLKGHELFIINEENGWCKVAMDDKWVSKDFLRF